MLPQRACTWRSPPIPRDQQLSGMVPRWVKLLRNSSQKNKVLVPAVIAPHSGLLRRMWTCTRESMCNHQWIRRMGAPCWNATEELGLDFSTPFLRSRAWNPTLEPNDKQVFLCLETKAWWVHAKQERISSARTSLI